MRDPGKNPTNIQKDLAQCTDGTTVSSTVVLCYTPVSHTTDPGKKNITESAAPPALHHADYALSFADSNHFHIPQSQTPPPPWRRWKDHVFNHSSRKYHLEKLSGIFFRSRRSAAFAMAVSGEASGLESSVPPRCSNDRCRAH